MSGSGLDSRYITSSDLTQYFVNKRTGEALAFGKLYFYRENARNEAKPVFQLVQGSNNPNQYSYVELPNPLTLSATGTPCDDSGNNIVFYYYPFDENGEVDLYYVECYDSDGIFAGSLQFTREAWPFPNVGGSDITVNNSGIVSNQIMNPGFTEVLFEAPSLDINYSGTGNKTVEFAPGWEIYLSYTGTGVVTITQTPVVGSDNLLNNPAYTLDISLGNNIVEAYIQQKFNHNPDWAAANNVEITGTGFVSGSILIAPGTTIIMQYLASSGNIAPQEILSVTNTDDAYVQFNNTVQLQVANSSDNGDNGFDLIRIVLPISGEVSLTNVQIVSLNENISNVAYEQTTSNRQSALMFNYYKPQLEYIPNGNYLIGWHFPLNPAQYLTSTVAAQAVGANKSYYAWDQTILFQSTDSGISVSRASSGAMRLTSAAVAGTKMGIVQYLPQAVVRDMLTKRKCVHIQANGSVDITATVSLWYMVGALPDMNSNNSIVLTLDANGYPDTRNGTWVQIPRSNLSNAQGTPSATNAAQITIQATPDPIGTFNNISLSGWDMEGNSDIYNATYFAIVIGTENISQNDYLDLFDVTCQDGDIPTVSYPETADEVLRKCQAYWEMSFSLGTAPVSNLGVNTGETQATQIVDLFQNQVINVRFNSLKNTTPTFVFYNPGDTGGQVRNETDNVNSTNTTAINITRSAFTVSFTTNNSTGALGARLGIHWVAKCRLGE